MYSLKHLTRFIIQSSLHPFSLIFEHIYQEILVCGFECGFAFKFLYDSASIVTQILSVDDV